MSRLLLTALLLVTLAASQERFSTPLGVIDNVGKDGVPGENHQCLAGVKAGPVCCAAHCGTCGGTGCESRPGGALDCCSYAIAQRPHGTCTGSIGIPPCIYRSRLSDAALDEMTNEMCCHESAPQGCFDVRHPEDEVWRLSWCHRVWTALNVTLNDPKRRPAVPPLRRAPPADGMKVDLWVTTKHEYSDLLMHLLESLQHFWPMERWRSEVAVVLNEDSEGDHELCGRLPSWVTCLLQAPPEMEGPDAQGWTWLYGRGMTRAVWITFQANLHVSPETDWIAILDPDVVFFSPFVPDLIFDWSGPEPRPVVFGGWHAGFQLSALSLDLNWVSQFMDSFPNMVRPRHLLGFQDFLMKLTNSSDFTQAYQRALKRVYQDCHSVGWWTNASPTKDESFIFQTAMYHYLWHYHREEFFWSLRDGAQHPGMDLRHTCPSLRAARHFGGDRSVKAGRRLESHEKQLEYAHRASRLMLAGHGGLHRDTQGVLLEALITGDTGPWEFRQPSHGAGSYYAMVGVWGVKLYAPNQPEYVAVHINRKGEMTESGSGSLYYVEEVPQPLPSGFTHQALLKVASGKRDGIRALLKVYRGQLVMRVWIQDLQEFALGVGHRLGNTSAHCGERTLENLLQVYASWDRALHGTRR